MRASSSSPPSTSRSSAYSRIVSSMPEARLAVGALGLADEAVVDERRDAVEHLAELQPERLARDGLGGLERGAADEDAEPREERLAARRRAGCSSTRSRRGACSWPPPPPVSKTSRFSPSRADDLLRRQQLHARSRQLDRERHALEAAADLGDRADVVVGELEARLGLLRALDEELHRGRVGRGRRPARARRAAAPGTRARRGRAAAPGSSRAPSASGTAASSSATSAAAGSTCSKLSSTSSVGASPSRSRDRVRRAAGPASR